MHNSLFSLIQDRDRRKPSMTGDSNVNQRNLNITPIHTTPVISTRTPIHIQLGSPAHVPISRSITHLQLYHTFSTKITSSDCIQPAHQDSKYSSPKLPLNTNTNTQSSNTPRPNSFLSKSKVPHL
ncbi:hypothetical protein KC19_2G082400 [Ceratodon purpureus]|uniref:Uncharacterized protein n=1 Tax=Ceratodon purpureus TaxID=3225 RepID=A0A8T0IT36_CERPU|nr:hypothetical protein KC19_2G082400 [Ceratodon purpureus]